MQVLSPLSGGQPVDDPAERSACGQNGITSVFILPFFTGFSLQETGLLPSFLGVSHKFTPPITIITKISLLITQSCCKGVTHSYETLICQN